MAKPPEKPVAASDNGEARYDQEIAQEVTRRISNLVPAGQREQVIAQVTALVTREQFSGPIAHPRHLREYDEIVPGSANRIIAMAESQLAHSQQIQSEAIAAEIADQKEGRRLGFAALVLLIAAALACVLTGHDAIATAFLGAGAVGIIGLFIKGRSNGASKDE